MRMAGSSRRPRMEDKLPFPYTFVVAAFGLLVTVSADSGISSFSTQALGINYGRVADDLPPPSVAVELIRQLKASYVKIYDANPEVLSALSGTGLQVVITVRNEDISNISSSPLIANAWIQTNVLPHYPSTLITTIMVGNEVPSQGESDELALLVPAMTNIHSALVDHNLGDAIKVTTSLAMDVFATSYPPSAGAFRDDLIDLVLQPMLDLLSRTNSYVFLDVYPFFAWSSDATNISLNYALLDVEHVGTSIMEDQGLTYSNMLDAQLDAAVAAMEKLGHSDIPLVISETGWPTKGDDDDDDQQPGASISNAAQYNQNLVRKALARPPTGTPRRPGTFIPIFIFSLFNEDDKPGPETERNWGLFYPDGSPVYPIVLSGQTGPVSHVYTSPSKNSSPGIQWCVVSPNAQVEEDDLQEAIDFACAAGGDCSLIEPNQPCYLPNTLISHASYAFNTYWQRTKGSGATCDFNGAAALTNSDPSFQGCVFEHD
ncbi:hypothetical protein SUGI_1158760 [Cryptomeria japonica]|uniref:probable glucan endo-1,3-beta-glucosidase A6 n=1 Tax=Cryptomeria japonica TaxID=3369 RepID=UPI00241475AA|nr:probable glucan endo-1,3-beta-glucosidase A6 [Cryptomeria japonica]GLJ54113.1 hypothetical protein SUGI_1158760 [Cryptomeria japonica]